VMLKPDDSENSIERAREYIASSPKARFLWSYIMVKTIAN
jgi:hypothetical protein